MKIVCQSCGAKYAIADEKVKGKVFKIRCKKCNEAIVVKGVEEDGGLATVGALPDMEEENEAATKVFDYSSYTVGSGGDPQAVWHVVVEGEQRGPFTQEQLRHFQEAGTVTVETYVWKEGFSEWKPLREVPELSGGAPSPKAPASMPAPARIDNLFAAEPAPSSGGGLFDSPASSGSGGLFDSGGGLFGGGGKADSPFGSSGGGLFGSGGIAKQEDVFSSAGAAAAKEDLFKALDAPGPLGGNTAAMTGARNESSVLFSLSNLQALAASPAPGAKAGSSATAGPSTVPSSSEASGLIDIRSLASALSDDGKKDAGSIDDILSFGGGGFAPALGAPVLSASRGGMSTGLKIGLIGGGVLILAAIVVVVIVLLQGGEDKSERDEQIALLLAKIEQMEKSGASEEDKAKARAELASAQTAKEEEEKTPEPTKETKPQAAIEEKKVEKSGKNEGERSGAARKIEGGNKSSRADGGDEKASQPSNPAPSSSGSSKSKASSELDELLGGGAPAKKPQQPSTPATSAPNSSSSGGGEMLTREQVQSGLNAVAPAVKRCGQGQSGSITIQVVISPAGRVSSATPTGAFAGTPIGACAARAVQSARFPKSSKELTVKYPFKF